jgi:hypothetical protein
MKHSGKASTEATNEIELRPDGWERFRGAVHAAAKSGPKHRQSSKDGRKARPASKGRVHKGKSRS